MFRFYNIPQNPHPGQEKVLPYCIAKIKVLQKMISGKAIVRQGSR